MITNSNSNLKLLIKLGGNALVHRDALNSFAQAISRLRQVGFQIVITHGGGPQISQAFSTAGESNEFINGYRRTSELGVQIVKKVLCSEIQTQIIVALAEVGVVSSGICGDENVFLCSKKESDEADLGFVGEIETVNTKRVETSLVSGSLPVVSAVGTDGLGGLFNINADSGAAALATEMQVDYLVLLTDVAGVYQDWPKAKSVLSEIKSANLNTLIDSVDKGMIPKLEAARYAIRNGVPSVLIINGENGSALEKYFLHQELTGTLVKL